MSDTTLGMQNRTNIADSTFSNTSDSLRRTTSTLSNHDHSNSPTVNIDYPSYPPTVTTGNMTLKGTANDSNGIKAISAAAYTFPLNSSTKTTPVIAPSLISHGSLSNWSIPFTFKQPGVYRIVVTARDNANNTGHAQTTVNFVPIKEPTLEHRTIEPRLAFVRPTFTEAAYQEHGFYRFYFKYGFPPPEKKITTDLDMLTVKTPRSISEFTDINDLRHLSNITSLVPANGTEFHDVSWQEFPHPQKFWMPFINIVRNHVPNATVTVMRDEDVNDGHIFLPVNNNKTNAYDVLLLFHNEYATQQEYDNLRQFVKNGGTIVFIDANVFFAQVRYDKDNHTITLVKGHNWKFDGKAAQNDVQERWYNETKEWVGGNYLNNDIRNNITFANNPFNYTHFEEQVVTNPKDKIILDYGLTMPAQYLKNPSLNQSKVATYSLDYGKGKVIMLGLTAETLVQNQAGKLVDNQKFKQFFDQVILPKALCLKFQSCEQS